MRQRMDLTAFDRKPEEMENYLRYCGPHFNEKLAAFAVSRMKKDYKPIEPIGKEQLKELLAQAGVKIENGQLADAVYVANMAKADYWGSSITDEKKLALFVKDYLDDEDGYDGIAFNRFLADCARKGVAIDWGEMV